MNQQRTATIPIFTIGEMKRMAKKQLSGKWLRLLPLMLIYTIFTMIPAFIVQLESYAGYSQKLNALAEADGAGAASGMLAAMETSSSAGLSSLSVIASALSLFIFLTAGAFSVSLAGLSLRVLRNEPFSIGTIFSGFSQFGKAFIANLLVSIFSFLWMLLFILPGSLFAGFGMASGSQVGTFLGFLALSGLLVAAIIFLMRYQMTFFIAADEDCTGMECVSRSVRLMKGNIRNYFLLQISFLPWMLLLCVPMLFAIGAAVMAVEAATAADAVLPVVLAVIFGIITLAGEMLLILYIQTASAVFYSGATGNFRSASSNRADTAVSPHIEKRMIDMLTAQNPQLPTEENDASKNPESAKKDLAEDNTADEIFDDETLSILESDDSLDHLYDEDKE